MDARGNGNLTGDEFAVVMEALRRGKFSLPDDQQSKVRIWYLEANTVLDDILQDFEIELLDVSSNHDALVALLLKKWCLGRSFTESFLVEMMAVAMFRLARQRLGTS